MHDTKFDPVISANFLKCILCVSWLFSSINLFILHLLPLNHTLANTVSRKGLILLEERAQERIFFLFYPDYLRVFPHKHSFHLKRNEATIVVKRNLFYRRKAITVFKIWIRYWVKLLCWEDKAALDQDSFIP